MPVKGIERVRRNMKLTLSGISEKKTEAAVFVILTEGMAASALRVPVDTSALINSAYLPQIDSGTGKTSGQIGYTAAYAQRVHDASGKLKGQPRMNGNGTYWSPDAEPNFLSNGFESIIPVIPSMLKRLYGV